MFCFFGIWLSFVIFSIIFICYPVAQKQAQEYQHSFDYEFCFLFTHGMLHLLGYDHETPKGKKIMFDLQDLILNEIDFN